MRQLHNASTVLLMWQICQQLKSDTKQKIKSYTGNIINGTLKCIPSLMSDNQGVLDWVRRGATGLHNDSVVGAWPNCGL